MNSISYIHGYHWSSCHYVWSLAMPGSDILEPWPSLLTIGATCQPCPGDAPLSLSVSLSLSLLPPPPSPDLIHLVVP